MTLSGGSSGKVVERCASLPERVSSPCVIIYFPQNILSISCYLDSVSSPVDDAFLPETNPESVHDAKGNVCLREYFIAVIMNSKTFDDIH